MQDVLRKQQRTEDVFKMIEKSFYTNISQVINFLLLLHSFKLNNTKREGKKPSSNKYEYPGIFS